MDGTGSNSRTLGLLVGLAVLACAPGCQSGGNQLSFANPFLSRDRVPPPTTRALVPGSAAPYYPGDPVPALQGAAPVQQPVLAAPSAAPPPITPITAAPVPAQTYVGSNQGYVPTPMSVATPPPSASTIPPGTPPVMAMNNTVQPAVFHQPMGANNDASPAGFAAGGQPAELADTGFTQPALPAAADPRVVLESSQPDVAVAPSTAEAEVPWRSPHGSPTGFVADNYQAVELQPVPTAYAPGPVEPHPAPRIRLPGSVPSGFESQPPAAAYVGSPGVPQTLAITELPAHQSGMLAAPPLAAPAAAGSPWQAAPSAPAATANYGSGATDGFRPRTSLR